VIEAGSDSGKSGKPLIVPTAVREGRNRGLISLA